MGPVDFTKGLDPGDLAESLRQSSFHYSYGHLSVISGYNPIYRVYNPIYNHL